MFRICRGRSVYFLFGTFTPIIHFHGLNFPPLCQDFAYVWFPVIMGDVKGVNWLGVHTCGHLWSSRVTSKSCCSNSMLSINTLQVLVTLNDTPSHSCYYHYLMVEFTKNAIFFSFSPTDNKFASCSDDGLVKIWDFYRCSEERVLRGTV